MRQWGFLIKFFKSMKMPEFTLEKRPPIHIWNILTQTTCTEINEDSNSDCMWYTVHISALNDVSKIVFIKKFRIEIFLNYYFLFFSLFFNFFYFFYTKETFFPPLAYTRTLMAKLLTIVNSKEKVLPTKFTNPHQRFSILNARLNSKLSINHLWHTIYHSRLTYLHCAFENYLYWNGLTEDHFKHRVGIFM